MYSKKDEVEKIFHRIISNYPGCHIIFNKNFVRRESIIKFFNSIGIKLNPISFETDNKSFYIEDESKEGLTRVNYGSGKEGRLPDFPTSIIESFVKFYQIYQSRIIDSNSLLIQNLSYRFNRVTATVLDFLLGDKESFYDEFSYRMSSEDLETFKTVLTSLGIHFYDLHKVHANVKNVFDVSFSLEGFKDENFLNKEEKVQTTNNPINKREEKMEKKKQ